LAGTSRDGLRLHALNGNPGQLPRNVIIIDGGPSSEIGSPDLGGLFEIWEDAAFGPLKPSADEDPLAAPGARTAKGQFPGVAGSGRPYRVPERTWRFR